MIQALLHFFTSSPPILGVVLMAMAPMVERFALPVAITVFHLPVLEAFLLVVLGNMVPVVLITLLAEKFHIWISINNGFFGRSWVKTLAHAQKKFAQYERWGLIGLVIFLALPTPFNGAFSASLVAFVLGYPMRKSLPYLFAGVIIGNLVALGLTTGAVRLF